MSWNYRIIVTRFVSHPNEEEFNIHEVYYNNEGAIEAWSTKPTPPHGSTKTELKEDLHAMLKAFDKPALYMEELEEILCR